MQVLALGTLIEGRDEIPSAASCSANQSRQSSAPVRSVLSERRLDSESWFMPLITSRSVMDMAPLCVPEVLFAPEATPSLALVFSAP